MVLQTVARLLDHTSDATKQGLLKALVVGLANTATPNQKENLLSLVAGEEQDSPPNPAVVRSASNKQDLFKSARLNTSDNQNIENQESDAVDNTTSAVAAQTSNLATANNDPSTEESSSDKLVIDEDLSVSDTTLTENLSEPSTSQVHRDTTLTQNPSEPSTSAVHRKYFNNSHSCILLAALCVVFSIGVRTERVGTEQ